MSSLVRQWPFDHVSISDTNGLTVGGRRGKLAVDGPTDGSPTPLLRGIFKKPFVPPRISSLRNLHRSRSSDNLKNEPTVTTNEQPSSRRASSFSLPSGQPQESGSPDSIPLLVLPAASPLDEPFSTAPSTPSSIKVSTSSTTTSKPHTPKLITPLPTPQPQTRIDPAIATPVLIRPEHVNPFDLAAAALEDSRLHRGSHPSIDPARPASQTSSPATAAGIQGVTTADAVRGYKINHNDDDDDDDDDVATVAGVRGHGAAGVVRGGAGVALPHSHAFTDAAKAKKAEAAKNLLAGFPSTGIDTASDGKGKQAAHVGWRSDFLTVEDEGDAPEGYTHRRSSSLPDLPAAGGKPSIWKSVKGRRPTPWVHNLGSSGTGGFTRGAKMAFSTLKRLSDASVKSVEMWFDAVEKQEPE
ncbi:hypothetical protein TWF696_004302 [Orbilia brochopaga]|uniref:Uncharacterized protein n=1 Tax=Orbilia brochopaga TaxID=3140254 RepID=A0AAV9V6F2_9PEZI